MSAKRCAVTCSVGGMHLLNVCLREEYDREQDDARKVLAPKEWWAEYRRR